MSRLIHCEKVLGVTPKLHKTTTVVKVSLQNALKHLMAQLEERILQTD